MNHSITNFVNERERWMYTFLINNVHWQKDQQISFIFLSFSLSFLHRPYSEWIQLSCLSWPNNCHLAKNHFFSSPFVDMIYGTFHSNNKKMRGKKFPCLLYSSDVQMLFTSGNDSANPWTTPNKFYEQKPEHVQRDKYRKLLRSSEIQTNKTVRSFWK